MTADPARVTSFPLERPAARLRRRDALTPGALPYFIAGDENRLVTFVSQASTSVFEFGNPLLLVGPSGCGKTSIALHLAARQGALQQLSGEPSAVAGGPSESVFQPGFSPGGVLTFVSDRSG